MISFYIIIIITLVLIFYGFIEYVYHQKRRKSIPIRIHINGSRGKSSVTRLIGAGLRVGNIRTITKVTGTFPRLILPNGSEAIIYRKEKANILEQVKIIKYASKEQAEAIVIECMALNPLYQKISEHKMIQATIGVITNVRLDHLDVMGPDLDGVAKSLSNTIPKNAILFTSEKRYLDFFEKESQIKNSIVCHAITDSISDEEMNGFQYLEHKENVALALTVCDYLGISKEKALQEMKKTKPDEGALKKFTVKYDSKQINFYNAFAANDPESTLFIWHSIKKYFQKDEIKILMLNTRQDRLDRSKQLITMVSKNINYDYIILTGESCNVVGDMGLKLNIPKKKIIDVGQILPEMLLHKINSILGKNTTIVGIGNMGAGGAETAKYFEIEHKKNNKI